MERFFEDRFNRRDIIKAKAIILLVGGLALGIGGGMKLAVDTENSISVSLDQAGYTPQSYTEAYNRIKEEHRNPNVAVKILLGIGCVFVGGKLIGEGLNTAGRL